MTLTALTSHAPAPLPSLRRWLSRWLGRRTGKGRHLPLSGIAANIGGQILAVTEVTSGGMVVVGYRGLLHVQDRFPFVLSLDGIDIAGESLVMWRRDGGLGAAFYRLSDADRATVQAWLVRRAG